MPSACAAPPASGHANHRQVWFDRGPLLDALLASSATPALYPSVRIDGQQYLDGAIVDDVPVRRAADLGAATLYVLWVGSVVEPGLR
jgi:NTE family protein